MFGKIKYGKGMLAKLFSLGVTITPNQSAIVINDRIMFQLPPNHRVMA